MSRPVGLPKTGGRKKGTRNKRSLLFFEILSDYNYHPLRNLLDKYDSLDVQEQMKIDLKLIEYVYAKPSENPVELPSRQNEVETLSPDERDARIRFLLNKRRKAMGLQEVPSPVQTI